MRWLYCSERNPDEWAFRKATEAKIGEQRLRLRLRYFPFSSSSSPFGAAPAWRPRPYSSSLR